MEHFNKFIGEFLEDEFYVCTLSNLENRKVECYGPFPNIRSSSDFQHEFLIPNKNLYQSFGTAITKKYYPYPLKLHILSRKFNPIVSKTSIISSKN